ncbi:MAG: TIGR03086 family metal-binding protein [Actinomycetota bacterium]|nr:TIGR03086 family metal-binding protein [Actinomycetota bacterium]
MGDIDIVESVLAKDGVLLAGVRAEQLTAPTPCPDYAVQALVNHIVGWSQVFAAAANGQPFEGDAASFVSTDAVAEFQASAAELVAGWRAGGVDRTVSLVGPDMPAQMVLNMTLMEYVTHGCDLAVATGQTVPFSEEELEVTLERARATLPEQFRGEGKPFGPMIDVAANAPALDRLFGFMGRRAASPESVAPA